MNFLSDDRATELRDLFFETAAEQLQRLNEAGLSLEAHPRDEEMIRKVRRTVHTLKGDSAACGFHELSKLAHELEDVLTSEKANAHTSLFAQAILTAADTFYEMLAAYRDHSQLPGGVQLRGLIRQLAQETVPSEQAAPTQVRRQAQFAWTEYEQMCIASAKSRGETIYHIALRLDPNCPMRAAARQLVRNVLNEAGTILALQPDDEVQLSKTDLIEAALATQKAREWVMTKGRIPGVISELTVEALPETSGILQRPAPAQPALTPATSAAPEAPRAESGAPSGPVGTGSAESSLRVDAARIDVVLNLVGELIIGKSVLQQTVNEFEKRFPRDPLRGKFGDAMALQARVLSDLQKSVMKVRMVPVEQLFRRMPRIVRDVAKLRGRDVALAITGQETDLDKSVVDALAEPLVHLVRNAVDHGIGSPEERLAAGKPARGTVRLDAYHQGNQVVIEVSDDGRGINPHKIMAKAVETGVITSDQALRLSEQEVLDLIFHPGLSTSDQVTEVSGRGVGMDVVKTAIEKLKGTVRVETTPQEGTTFRLKLPLTLAIIKALLFRVDDNLYAIPLAAVLEITRVGGDEIHQVNGHQVMYLRNETLTLVWLDRMVQRQKSSTAGRYFVVVVGFAGRRFGLVVDRLVGEEELVIKPLDDNLVSTELVSGASVLGDGTVALILNIPVVISQCAKAAEEAVEVSA